ncbi:MAG: 8-oxo-dGTP diphosphatase [Candidatus Paceibacterota bacterium]
MQQIDLTLTIVTDTQRVLLGMKKRGFGAGKWNGFGGKVEAGEDFASAAHRELQEEVGVVARDLQKCGTLEFVYEHTRKTHNVTVFCVSDIQGTPIETDEMRPQWFPYKDIPYDAMWADDPFWLPLALAGVRFKGRFVFKDDQTILTHEVVEL